MRSVGITKSAPALFFILTHATLAVAATADATTVRTSSGLVRGALADGVISFKGIPYVQPPVGALRWRPPQALGRWTGVRPATSFGPECMQSDNVPKSEDCLTLNVWRPAGRSAPLPVMVWIYGGGLVHGQTSLYPADNLARQGVIVVSMNYRMGRLGFFAHPALTAETPNEIHGNYGYLDQRAALQWVQRNIKAFGGNPKAVTIFGESAGGGSVLAHLVSPFSRGLFQRAILQSPGIPTPRAKVIPMTALADAERRGLEYARSIGVTADGPDALKALRALSAGTFIEGASTQQVIGSITSESSVPGVSGAILDGKFVVESPELAIASGRWAKVPIVVGANNRDLGAGTAGTKDQLFAMFGSFADEARKLYDPEGTETLDELKQQVFADKTMTEPERHLADLVARSGEPVWLYRFSYVAEALRGAPRWKGTPHGMEIPYTFDLPAAIVKDKVTAADKKMGDIASAYWVTFAKRADPNGAGRPDWPRHRPGIDRIINFTNDGVVAGPDPIKPRLDLWENVWSQNR
jgi:para-nitrobenzyl esterase